MNGNRNTTTNATNERPTLRTIAYMTGLSVASVSKALKDFPDISKETKDRVRMVAAQIGYYPNRAGVRLRTGKTNVISLILNIDEELMGLTSHIIYGISETLADTDYHLIVTPYSRQKDPVAPVRYILDTGSADGVILSSSESYDPRVKLLSERRLPFVTHGRTDMDIVHPYHDFDNEAYAYDAVRRLTERGRRTLSILEPLPKFTFHRHLKAGFLRGLNDFGAQEIPFPDVALDDPIDSIYESTRQMLDQHPTLDGIIAGSSAGAVVIASAADASGRRLGKDIDIVSKQPPTLLRYMRPEILTAREDLRLAGRELAKALLARIDGEAPERLQSLSTPDGQLIYPGRHDRHPG